MSGNRSSAGLAQEAAVTSRRRDAPARTDRLHILLTDEERRAAEAAAERDGETLSSWVRRAIREKLRRESPPPERPPTKRSRR